MKTRALLWLLCALAVLAPAPTSYCASGEATLGEDQRNRPCPANFGFAYYEKDATEVDICTTLDNSGNHTLVATDGVASPENPEPIMHYVGLDGEDTVTFVGRTEECYYIVTGTRASGNANVGGRVTKWNSEFDSNQETAHFVVTINVRERSDDDVCVEDIPSLVRVELHDEVYATPGYASFVLRQEPAPGGTAAITFVDSGGNAIDPDEPRTVYVDSPNTDVYIKGAELGTVIIIADEATGE
jgi:hypothetical protein